MLHHYHLAYKAGRRLPLSPRLPRRWPSILIHFFDGCPGVSCVSSAPFAVYPGAQMRPLFLLAPGAGASSTHPWMQRWRAHLQTLGYVETFDYDYMRAGRKRPDRLPDLIAAHRRALHRARERHPAASVILIGKSMGGRIGCHVAFEEKIDRLVCLSYPLCGGGDRARLRDAVLRSLRTPILFVQGTRDTLCPLDLLATVRDEMRAPHCLHVVEGGDHSLAVGKRLLAFRGKSQNDVDEEILQAISSFLTQQ